MCRAHATVRGVLSELVEVADDAVVIDMEAGLEHFSRGTARNADAVLAILEPYYRSLETGARVMELARELGIGQVHAIANKVRGDADRQAIEAFCQARGISLLAMIPHDEAVVEADRSGAAVLDHSPDAPIVKAVRALAERLVP